MSENDNLFCQNSMTSDLQLDIDFLDPTEDQEFEVRALLASLLATTPYADTAVELAKLICQQPEVGTVMLAAEGGDILGFMSCLSFTQHIDRPSVVRLLDLVLDALSTQEEHSSAIRKLFDMLEAGTATVGLLITGRYANLPGDAAAALHRVLSDDLRWISSDAYDSSTPARFFTFTHIICLSKGVFAAPKDPRAPEAKDITRFLNIEDGELISHALHSAVYPADLGQYNCWVVALFDVASFERAVNALEAP
ncbi:p21-C-terminal region-binding protein [Giardia muris]|uniref:p21-C-terminal region-binding protein n=1 Tax=Giardia muris TaxID=5742 RepID=A0A4Z1T1Z1_GIAMU|nr:p21-C-terminal region-binding protein [Giardia muris]|eukprot:TNJ27017.1 p21-C-terminal region-binding protein [Giardia muris]